VAALHARGIETSIVSGDNWRVARAVAASVGIRHVVAEALPAGRVIHSSTCLLNLSRVGVTLYYLSARPEPFSTPKYENDRTSP
jgi:magnesium-transporting ATPase (P-type)